MGVGGEDVSNYLVKSNPSKYLNIFIYYSYIIRTNINVTVKLK